MFTDEIKLGSFFMKNFVVDQYGMCYTTVDKRNIIWS